MRNLWKAAVLAAALTIPAAAFAGQAAPAAKQSTKKAPAKTEAKAEKKAPAVRSATTSGTVKSSTDTTLVITRGAGKNAKDETFTVNSSTKKEGTIDTGAKVKVAYTKDGTNMVATSITVVPAKAAKAPAKSKKK